MGCFALVQLRAESGEKAEIEIVAEAAEAEGYGQHCRWHGSRKPSGSADGWGISGMGKEGTRNDSWGFWLKQLEEFT